MKKKKTSNTRKDNNGKRRLVYEGTIVKPLKNILFHVRLDHNGQTVLGYLSGNMRRKRIEIILHDRVEIEISEFDSKKGRIVRRIDFPKMSHSETGIEQTIDDHEAMENPTSPESLLDTESKNPNSSQSTEDRDSEDNTKPNQD